MKKPRLLVISNHVRTLGMEFPSEAVVRINLAWLRSVEEVRDVIEGIDRPIFLDYPTGRTKPPVPTLSLLDALGICREYASRIPYFAFSNAEDPNFVGLIRHAFPETVQLVPKIETRVGVERLPAIVEAARCGVIMLDAEDLYTDCGHEPVSFEFEKRRVMDWCEKNGVRCLRLGGVVFTD